MTTQDANDNIGKPFKPLIDGAAWDTIITVDENGFIEGEKYIVHADDARLKDPVPAQLQNHINKLKQISQ